MKKWCNTCKQQATTCDESSPSVLPIISPLVNDGKSDCGTCWGLQTDWELENGYEAKLLSAISKDQLPTFDSNWNPTWCVDVSELPYGAAGLITFTNGNNAETFEYMYDKWVTVQIGEDGVERCFLENIPGNPGTICILKRGIHPAATNLITDWEWANTIIISNDGDQKEVSPDYNNCEFMFAHFPGATARRGTYAQEHSIFLQHTCCVCATTQRAGIMRASKDSDSGACPVAITNDDFANCSVNGVDNIGIVRGLSKCVEEGDEYVVSYNDYATPTRAGLAKITDIRTLDCSTGNIQTITPAWDIPETALNASQHAFPNIYGSSTLSRCIEWSIAVAKNDNATCTNNGLTILKPLKANHICPSIPSSLWICGDIDTPTRVVQEFDYADSDHYGLVTLSKALDENLQCPVVVTKHDWAKPGNCGIVSVKDACGDGCEEVPSMCSYASDTELGLNYMSVDPTDCNQLTVHTPDNEHPIATSTEDKRNFKQVIYFEKNYTDWGTTPGLFIPAWWLWNASGIDFSNPNTSANAIENTGSTIPVDGINNWDFYCYSTMNNGGRNIVITQEWFYHLHFIVKYRNTKTQLEGNQLGNSNSVTHSARININGNNSEIGDLNLMLTTLWDPAYQPADPRYSDSIRTSICDSNGVRYLQAWDIIDLRVSFDNLDTYLLYVELWVFCIQPTL